MAEIIISAKGTEIQPLQPRNSACLLVCLFVCLLAYFSTFLDGSMIQKEDCIFKINLLFVGLEYKVKKQVIKNSFVALIAMMQKDKEGAENQRRDSFRKNKRDKIASNVRLSIVKAQNVGCGA